MATPEARAERVTRAETRGSALLWFGILAGPLAWGVQLASLYMLEEFISCTAGSQTQGKILGFSVTTVALAITAAVGGITILAGVISVACHRRLAGAGNDPRMQRARWMAAVGIINSAMFFFIIAIKAAPPILLDVCRISP